MFLERKTNAGKLNSLGAVAGYDLGSKTAQISYCLPGQDKPETVSQTAGEEDYLIPAMLARRTDKDLWLYGQEARERVLAGEAVPVVDLLADAAQGKKVEVLGESYDSVSLLSLFIKKSLALLSPVLPLQRLQAFVFTVEEVTRPVIEALQQVAAAVELQADHIYVIGRAEGFFYYNINQPEELWVRDVLVCDFSGQYLKTLLFSVNRKTTPVASFVEEESFAEVQRKEPAEDEETDRRNGMKLDRQFAASMEGFLEGRRISTVYLIGEGFAGEWYEESLQVLCRDRRVFLGNNLYSKGACYAGRERLNKGSVTEGYAFLGKDMLKSNLGMHVVRRGTDAYLALLDAGINWYEAQKECEFLLEEKNSFSLRITPLNGKEMRRMVVTLNGLPARPARTTRIRLKVDMTDAETVRINMEDLGFGEFFPATHKFWEEIFKV